MKIHFYKYQATGNDFVMIDNRSGQYSFTIEQIKKICDRKFGVGADGLMLIEPHAEFDFNLQYFNSDGSQSLCGNGCRAAMHFASFLGMVMGNTRNGVIAGITLGSGGFEVCAEVCGAGVAVATARLACMTPPPGISDSVCVPPGAT